MKFHFVLWNPFDAVPIAIELGVRTTIIMRARTNRNVISSHDPIAIAADNRPN